MSLHGGGEAKHLEVMHIDSKIYQYFLRKIQSYRTKNSIRFAHFEPPFKRVMAQPIAWSRATNSCRQLTELQKYKMKEEHRNHIANLRFICNKIKTKSIFGRDKLSARKLLPHPTQFLLKMNKHLCIHPSFHLSTDLSTCILKMERKTCTVYMTKHYNCRAE